MRRLSRLLSIMALWPMVVILTTPIAYARDWEAFRGDPARTGYTSEDIGDGNLNTAPLWEVNLGSRVLSSPVVANGLVYIGTQNGILYCFDAAGSPSSVSDARWSYKAEGEIISTPVVVQNRIYFGCTYGYLYCLDATTGTLRWRTKHGGKMLSSPVVHQWRESSQTRGLIYVTIGDPHYDVRAYDLKYGFEVWSYCTGQISYSSPALLNSRLFVGSGNGFFFSLFPITSNPTVVQKYSTAGGVFLSTPAVNASFVVCAPGDHDYSVYALDSSDIKNLVKEFEYSELYPSGKVSAKTGRDEGERRMPGIDYEFYLQLQNEDPEVRLRLIEDYEAESGEDLTALKELLCPEVYQPSYASGPPSNSARSAIKTSSPALTPEMTGFPKGLIYVVQRELGSPPDLRLFCLDPSGGKVVWTYTVNPFSAEEHGFCSSPVVAADHLYVAIGNKLLVFSLTSNTPVQTIENLRGNVFSSPAVANGRVYLATYDYVTETTSHGGYLYAFSGGNSPPRPPIVLGPTGGENLLDTTPRISWEAAPDSDVAGYIIQIDYDGELDWTRAFEESVSSSQLHYDFVTPIPESTHVAYRIRTVDERGAYSTWTPVHRFWVQRDMIAPAPPLNLTAIPADRAVRLVWEASPSPDVMYYRLFYRQEGLPYIGPYDITADRLEYTFRNLENFVEHTFLLMAVDRGENESESVTVKAKPMPMITVRANGGYSAHRTIQEAVAAASTRGGGKVILGEGTIMLGGGGNTIILPPNVSIEGYSPLHTVIHGRYSDPVIRVQSTVPKGDASSSGDVTPNSITGLTIVGGRKGIVVEGNARILIKNVVVAQNRGDGISIGAGSIVEIINVTVADNYADRPGEGRGIYTEGTKTLIRNSLIIDNAGHGIENGGTGEVKSSFNCLYNNPVGNGGNQSGNFKNVMPGGGDFPALVNFVNRNGFDYREVSGSATVDAGDPNDEFHREPVPNGGRINIGAYGNTPFATKTVAAPTGIAAARRGGGGRCFIVEASVDPESPELQVLRGARDRFLRTSTLGSRLVDVYYAIGPCAADFIRMRESIRAFIREVIP